MAPLDGSDLFAGKAKDYDERPVPQQISDGVFRALQSAVQLTPDTVVLDFGAGTGLISGKIAPLVKRVIAVDISAAMLERLASKPELAGKADIHCRDIVREPLDERVDLVVSAMAMHHVHDTDALLQALFDHLRPGGCAALADLDLEDGDFHPPDIEGVYHQGFDRTRLAERMTAIGFDCTNFSTACEVERDGKRYPIFLVTAKRPA